MRACCICGRGCFPPTRNFWAHYPISVELDTNTELVMSKLPWIEMDRFPCGDFLSDNEERLRWKERRRGKNFRQYHISLERSISPQKCCCPKDSRHISEREACQKEAQIRARWLETVHENFFRRWSEIFWQNFSTWKNRALLKCSMEKDFHSNVPNMQESFLVTFRRKKKKKFCQNHRFFYLGLEQKSFILVKAPLVWVNLSSFQGRIKKNFRRLGAVMRRKCPCWNK